MRELRKETETNLILGNTSLLDFLIRNERTPKGDGNLNLVVILMEMLII